MHSGARGSLERHLPRTATNEDELFAMRRAAWRKQGIAVLRISTDRGLRTETVYLRSR